MNLSDMRFPRQLEVGDAAETIRRTLMSRTAKLWPGGYLEIPVIPMTDALGKALRVARLKKQLRYGFEAIVQKLENENKGISHAREISPDQDGNRISRLLLFSDDGADRFYRHIEQLLLTHAPRILGCLLDTDCRIFGRLLTDQDRLIKIVMIEHKAAVSQALCAISGQGK